MDAVKFVEERRRMFAVTGEAPKYTLFNKGSSAEDVVKEVEEWSAAHPRKTRQSVFLEQYPRANLLGNGVITICPKAIEKGYAPSAGSNDTNCFDCKTKYWMQEVEV